MANDIEFGGLSERQNRPVSQISLLWSIEERLWHIDAAGLHHQSWLAVPI
jgi:hypothetical protein